MTSSGTSRIRSVNADVGGTRSEFTLTIATNATGDGDLLALWDLSVTASHTPGAGEIPSLQATNFAAAINLLGSTYVATPDGATITVARVDGAEVIPQFGMSSDSTATVTLSGTHYNEKVLDNATVATTGIPSGIQSGFGVSPSLPVDDRTNTITLNVQLTNISGGAKTARWRLWWFTPGIGWGVDQEVGVRTITDDGTGTPAGIANDIISVTAIGATRVACELVDDGAAANLINCWVDTWAVVAH